MSRFFFSPGGGDSLDYLSVIYAIIRIEPGVGVGVGAGVRVDQKPGVGAGVGVGTSPPRLRIPVYRETNIPSFANQETFTGKQICHLSPTIILS